MKIISTIHDSYRMTWKIHVNPAGVKDPTEIQHRPLISFWSPDDDPTNRMLIFNPKIALVSKVKFDYDNKTKNMYIPISQVYTFIDKLMRVYTSLSSDKIKRREGGKLYIDKNELVKNAQKFSVFSDSVTIAPCTMFIKDTELLGVQFAVNGEDAGQLPHPEARELCEKLSHMDIQVYAAVLAMAEQIDQIDSKVDSLLSMQKEILNILRHQEEVQNVKITPEQSTGLNWESLT